MTNIVIVGGGTSGWSAAAFLSKNKDFNLTVIEPSNIPTIGVGESTIPYINTFHSSTELEIFDNNNWVNEVDGTLKFSIEFADYNKIGSNWIHPFLSGNSFDHALVDQTCKSQLPINEYYDQPDFVVDNFVLPNLGYNNFVNNDGHHKIVNAGYHIDAVKYANLLKEESLKRTNVKLIDDSVIDICLDKNNNIKELILNNSIIKADIFIDCTGFNALLANAVGSEWDDSYTKRLFVDCALAVQLPYIDKSKQMRNTTYCHALKNGWVWNVPLQTRIGTGYVYSSRHTTQELATLEFKRHLNSMYGYDIDSINVRSVPFKVGIRPESWKNNVVAIGLSSFFLEPIESTAIATMHYQIATLYDMLNSKHILAEDKVKRFNYANKLSVDAIASYIEMHYIFTQRSDSSFWTDVRNLELTDIQRSVLNLYSDPDKELVKETVKAHTNGHSLFDQSSFMFLFLGYDIAPNQMTDRVREYLS